MHLICRVGRETCNRNLLMFENKCLDIDENLKSPERLELRFTTFTNVRPIDMSNVYKNSTHGFDTFMNIKCSTNSHTRQNNVETACRSRQFGVSDGHDANAVQVEAHATKCNYSTFNNCRLNTN